MNHDAGRIAELRQRAAKLPRIPLLDLPTPVTDCRRFSASLGGGVHVFMKRDDLGSIGMGGNKLRKLEFSLAEALATGCDVVVHGLAGQSNYCRQTAAAAASVGLPCILLLRRDHKTEDPPQANRLLDYVFGAEVRMMPNDCEKQQADRTALVAELRAKGRKPYLIGRHDEILGAVAYALALAELLEQQTVAGLRTDAICVTGQSGTTAGLLLGKRLLRFEGRVQGFAVSPAEDEQNCRRLTAGLATEAAALLGYDEKFSADNVLTDRRYAGREYGQPTPECLDALLLLGRTEGLVVGPVYTAKGLSGMMGHIREARFPAGSNVVFLHTGGTPEIFSYNAEIAERLQQSGR
jgi:1-aminocyclopropane-1-carboxylate deaminase/D-cysteine desulfhydrase-like pyridoxal-dependent ACC family enzyme